MASGQVYSFEFWDAFTFAEYRDIALLSRIDETAPNNEQIKSAGVLRFMTGINSRGVVTYAKGQQALDFFESKGIISAERKQEIIEQLQELT